MHSIGAQRQGILSWVESIGTAIYSHQGQHKFKESQKTHLSVYWFDGTWFDVTNQDISKVLKEATRALQYLKLKGIHEDNVDTHSLRAGGANALALLGYSDQ